MPEIDPLPADQADSTAGSAAVPPRGKPFPRGRSGNPAGRPPGRRNVASAVAATLLADEAEDLVRRALERARGGDVRMLTFLLERLIPPARDRVVTMPGKVPDLGTIHGITEAARRILDAVGSGSISPQEAAALGAVVEVARKSVEVADLERRLEGLAAELTRLRESGHVNA